MTGILDYFRLDGRVAIVTGCDKGLGQGMTVALAEAGADIFAKAVAAFGHVDITVNNAGILEEADVCRLAMNTGGTPYIVPLNFGYSWADDLVLYFHSAGEGRKIDLLKENYAVGFELDTAHVLAKAEKACDWGMKYRSIIGSGRVEFIEDDAGKNRALQAIMKKYGFPGEAAFDDAMMKNTKVYKLIVQGISGKEKK